MITTEKCQGYLVFHNITERKKRELALIESELRFSTVFHKNPLAIGISNYSSGQFIDVNEAFLQLFGYERDEVIGHTALELNFYFIQKKKFLFVFFFAGRRTNKKSGVNVPK